MRSLLSLTLLLAVAACRKPATHDLAWKQRQIDSLFNARTAEINERAMEDLDQRRSIVVKQKADSILEARSAAAAPDSTRPPHPMP